MSYLTHSRNIHLEADPYEIGMELEFINPQKIHGKVGNFINFVTFSNEKENLRIGTEALLAIHFHGDQKWETPLDSIDGRIAFYGDFEHAPFSLKVSLEHISSHLADGTFGGSKGFDKILNHLEGYSREFLRCIFSYHTSLFTWYGGSSSIIHIAEPFELRNKYYTAFQLGQKIHFRILDIPFYMASDFQSKGELHYFVNMNHRIGLDHRLKIFMNFYKGFDTRGSYWKTKIQQLGFGISLPVF